MSELRELRSVINLSSLALFLDLYGAGMYELFIQCVLPESL